MTEFDSGMHDARIEEVDVEAALAFSEVILSHAAVLWQRTTVEQRRGSAPPSSQKG